MVGPGAGDLACGEVGDGRLAEPLDIVAAALRILADGPLKGILGYTFEKLVSSDFNHNPHSSIFHMDQTKVMDGNMVSIMSWYDNEWGYSSRVADLAKLMMA